MANFSQSRTLSEIRFRRDSNWPSGHIAQLKLAVQRLESQINSSLAQSVKQTASRRVSDQVPFVLPNEFTISPGFRQAQASWEAPPGLNGHPFRQLLFYEIQHDTTPSFPSPTTITTAQRVLTLGGLGAGNTKSFRIRVVNTQGVAGPWSEVKTVRLARNRIELTKINDLSGTSGINKRLTKAIGEWQTVLESTYQPFGGKVSFTVQASLACPRHDLGLKVGGNVVETYYGGPGFAAFRYMIGEENSVGDIIFQELGSSRFILSARPGFLAANNLEAKTPVALGSFPSVFFPPKDASKEFTVRIQAAKLVGTEWKGRRRNRALLTSDPLVSIYNPLIIEVLES